MIRIANFSETESFIFIWNIITFIFNALYIFIKLLRTILAYFLNKVFALLSSLKIYKYPLSILLTNPQAIRKNILKTFNLSVLYSKSSTEISIFFSLLDVYLL